MFLLHKITLQTSDINKVIGVVVQPTKQAPDKIL